jgi:hypothetical protein
MKNGPKSTTNSRADKPCSSLVYLKSASFDCDTDLGSLLCVKLIALLTLIKFSNDVNSGRAICC